MFSRKYQKIKKFYGSAFLWFFTLRNTPGAKKNKQKKTYIRGEAIIAPGASIAHEHGLR